MSFGSLASNLSSKLELSLSCSKLPAMDHFSESDPFVVVYMQDNRGSWYELSRTEYINNQPNPIFSHRILLDYLFEQVQRIRFEVYDCDSDSTILADHDFIGLLDTTISNIVTKPGRKLKAPLGDRNGKALPKGTITIIAEELKGSNELLNIQMVANDLTQVGWLFKAGPDAYLSFHKKNAGGSLGPQVCKTEVVKHSVHPSWSEFSVSMPTLCNADRHRPIVIRCLHSSGSASTNDTLIGECTTSVAELEPDYIGVAREMVTHAATAKRQFTLTQPDHQHAEKRSKSRGTLNFRKVFLRVEPTFLDYIHGGLQINLMVAIDFTASNGHPKDKGSLHYRGDPSQVNPYQRAIQSITDIVLPYDADGRIVTWGFGAQLVKSQPVSHCFHLNFNPRDPEVEGLAGMMQAYAHAVDHVTFSGPTLFAPLLTEATNLATQSPYTSSSQHYSILLIITDGVINDMDETIAAIVRASDKPLSIIIVGVGNADFSAMEILDADDSRLSAFGETQKRDTVQFVPMREFEHRSPAELAAHTLAELPTQVIEFMKLHNIPPLPPLTAQPSMSSIQQGSMSSSSSSSVAYVPAQKQPASSSSSYDAPPPYEEVSKQP